MEKYEVQETLASGSTAKIKKVVTTGDKEYAIKLMRKESVPLKVFLREVKIHKSLKHPNIVEIVDSYEDRERYCIVMRLGYGEVGSMIQSGVGLDPLLANVYFRQLVSAVRYLHSKGICHRDIKPENMLIDANGNLLLSDFGFSTLFLRKGKKRRLRLLAGSPEYMAPEVFEGDYDGSLADIWSCGISLIAFLTGTLPWGAAEKSDEQFSSFISKRDHSQAPFDRIRGQVMRLIMKILVRKEDRLSASMIMEDPWVVQPNRLLNESGLCKDAHGIFELIPCKSKTALHFTQPGEMHKTPKACFISSQPERVRGGNVHRLYAKKVHGRCVVKEICEVLDSMVVSHRDAGESVVFSTIDSKRSALSGEIGVRRLDGDYCVTVRRTRGDAREFEKFVKVFEGLIGYSSRMHLNRIT
ncbi:serine/threonine-specific kinase [Encephalitozoon hellem ATCC 50504]|uniref:non-specific serine/threonine protein kinase n=1 Tax=Encephalitozoon hellem TaxID=27973 RepID=A0A9Q9CB64_ENCHE|nr:serine/threonine-specific kinase [Encephalitozoon hellem ATCC 50504]AFM97950.1 serine/threonine-specific kinase [Encephalitozoon hellem ATCC 50504]UTX42754.1 5'-AMP-activated protein kinase catalytic subunit alpha-1 [Encephalitozoon hellem]|eukprot:XP_003886931.1 serine/threonine-specific kinase [Encephalitozoon hellem ATCC 50504]